MLPEDFYCAPAQTAGSAEIMQRKHVQSKLPSTYLDLMTAGAPWRYLVGILSYCGGGGAKFRLPPSMPPEDFYCAPAQTAGPAEILSRKHTQSRLLSTYFDLMTAGAPWR